MDTIRLAALGTFVVLVAVILAGSALNLMSVRRGDGPDRRAIRIQAITGAVAIVLFATLGIASVSVSGLWLLAVVAVPFIAVGLLLLQKAWRYH